MPGHCAPWPGNTNTASPAPARATPGPAGAGRSAASAASAGGQFLAVGADHHGAVLERRPAGASEHATSAGVQSRGVAADAGQPRGLRRAARRPLAARQQPEHRHRRQARRPLAARALRRGRLDAPPAGASSMITCALVPLIPNDDTPARRGRPGRRPRRCGSVSSRDARRRPSPRAATARRRAASRGSTPCRSAMTILITPATPAAAWVWPMFDFTEPSHSGRPRRGPGRRWPAAPGPRSGRRARCRCRAPRPRPRRRRASPALASAARITRCCDGPFGAVRPLDWRRPGSPRGRAPRPAPGGRCAARRTAAPPAARRRPRAQPMPSAPAANALHRPSAARPRCRENSDERLRGRHHRRRRRPAPACTPRRAAPGAARCSATSDEEHAVSTVTAGPFSPSV